MKILIDLLTSSIIAGAIFAAIYILFRTFDKLKLKNHMNKSEINSKIEDLKSEIKKLEQLVNKPEINKEKEMSDFLFSMLNKTIREMTDERNVTYYRASDHEWLFQQDYKNGYLWVRYTLIWNVFENKFGLNYNQIRDFISAWVKKNTEWRGLAPVEICF